MTKQLLRPQAAQAQKLELLNPVLLKTTPDAQTAFQLMVSMSGVTHESLGESIGKARETVTRFCNGNAGLTPNKLEALINECGNVYFLQYLANQFGFELTPIDVKAKRKAELMAELAELEQAA